ncbi:UNVERIFIED_CONTAM: hypothetical protein PYX00_008320 [Menopon gallinae]|uniref:Uncharacterized protein n=1 Tax=Menopon gallinae TaxID=328185 RepID=A0AAW2HN93_9NEOP
MTPDPSPVNVPPPTINLNSGSQTSPRKEQSLASIFTAISEDISLNSILNKISGVGSQMSLSSVMGVKKGGKPTNPPQQPEPVSHPPSMSLSSKKTDVYSRLAQAASQVSKELRLMESHCQKDGKVKASLRDLPRAMEENRCKEKQDRPFDQGNEKMSDLSFGEAIGIDKKLSPSSMALRNRRYSNNHTLVNFLVKLSKEPSLAADLAAFLGGGGNKPRKSRKEESLSSILTKVAKDPSFATDLAIILSESSLAESLHDGSYQKIPEIDTSSRSDERSKSTNEVSGSDNSSKMSSEVCFNYKKPGKKNVVLVTEKDRGPPSGNYRDKYLDYQIYPVRNNGPPLTGASKYGHDKPLPVKTKSSPVSLPQKDISTTDTSDGESNPSENSTIDLNSSKSDSKKSLNDSSNDLAERSSDESKDPASEDSERASDEQLLADDLARLLKANSQGKSDDAKAREEPVSSDDPLKVKSLLDILRKVSREPSLSTALVNVLTKRSSVTFKNAAEGKTPQKVEDSQNRTRKGTSGKLITSQSGTSTSSKKSHPSETDKKKEGATPSQPLLVSAIMNASPRVPSSASDLDKSKESLYSAYDDKTESEKAQPAPITEKRTFGSLGECIAEILARVTGERGLLTDFTKIASTKHQSVASIFDRVSKGNSQSSVSSNIRKKLSLPGDLGKVDGENRNSADSNYDSDDTDRMEKDTSQPEGENIGRRLQGRVNFEADPARSEIDTERPEVETLHRQEDLNESIKSRRSTDTRRSGDDEISSDLCKKPGTDEDGQLKLVRSGKVDVSDASFFEEYYLRVEEHEAVVQEYAGTFDPAESNSNTVRLSLCPKASIISNDQNIILEDCIVRFDVKDNSEKVCVETHFLVTSGSSTRDFASNQSLEEDRIKKVEDVSEEKKSETSTGSKKQLFFDSESIEYDPETGKKVIVGRFVTDP